MNDHKYLRLAGYDSKRAAFLKQRNDRVSALLGTMCLDMGELVFDTPAKGDLRPLLQHLRQQIQTRPQGRLPEKDFLRACHRVHSLCLALEKADCIIGRNTHLDALNIKQIAWHYKMDTSRSNVGSLARTLAREANLRA